LTASIRSSCIFAAHSNPRTEDARKLLAAPLEPVDRDFEGSTHEIREGAEHVGLAR
jgi:hypothetical protein